MIMHQNYVQYCKTVAGCHEGQWLPGSHERQSRDSQPSLIPPQSSEKESSQGVSSIPGPIGMSHVHEDGDRTRTIIHESSLPSAFK